MSPLGFMCASADLTIILDHFHVHIVHASQSGILGMTVGQAHLLDDIISMVHSFVPYMWTCRSWLILYLAHCFS